MLFVIYFIILRTKELKMRQVKNEDLVFIVSTLEVVESDGLMTAVAKELLIPDPSPIITNLNDQVTADDYDTYERDRKHDKTT